MDNIIITEDIHLGPSSEGVGKQNAGILSTNIRRFKIILPSKAADDHDLKYINWSKAPGIAVSTEKHNLAN